MPNSSSLGHRLPRPVVWSFLGLWMAFQVAFSVQGIANYWQWGHNGFNSAAYQQAARNALRWGGLFPVQYIAGPLQPEPGHAYTHAPLGLHLHTTLSVALFGDGSNWPVRLVPALGGIAAALMLFVFIRRRWGDLTAIISLGIYVFLPINQAFANMSNHSSWMIFWGVAMFYCHLRWLDQSEPNGGLEGISARPKLWLVGTFVCAGMCMLWDWPAYYLVLVLAVQWFYSSFRHKRPTLGLPFPLHQISKQHLYLSLFCIFVLANFFGFFALAYSIVGDFEEIKTSFQSRHNPTPDVYTNLVKRTLIPMFSPVVLLIGSLWWVGFLVRHARGEARKEDTLVVGFGFAACVHTLLFKTTAVIHIYWPWPANPFFAIACALVLVWFGTFVRDLVRVILGKRDGTLWRILEVTPLLVALFVFSYAYLDRVWPRIEEGRKVAGSFGYKNYKSDHHKVLFAERLKTWTTWETGILVMRHMPFRIEFVATMDRAQSWVTRADLYKPPPGLPEISDGWVLVGEVRRTPRSHLLRAAKKHPYRQWGKFYMIDYRTQGQDIKVWDVRSDPSPSWTWRVFQSSWENPLREERNAEAEEKMRVEVAQLTKRQEKPKRKPLKPKKSQKNESVESKTTSSDDEM